jgi:hypothetical protein
MNYTQLVNQINAYTENQFGTDSSGSPEVDTFIKQAEQRIYNTIQFPSLRKNVTGATYINNKYLSAPNDFLSVFSMAVVDDTGAYSYLLDKDVNFIREAYPVPTDTGLPQYYALFGPTTTNAATPVITNELSFILGPTPDDAYTIELHYYYYPESITTAATSWLGDNFDSVLFYGSLLEAYTYMKGEADVYTAYQKRYDEALAMAKRLGDGLERGDAYRDGQYKQKVV